MHRFMIRLTVFVMFYLTGCDTVMPLSVRVKAVQAEAVRMCQYLPAVNSVAAILSAANATVTGTGAVAQAICSAMAQWQASQGKGVNAMVTECPRVNDVCVEGQFVNEKGK